MQSDHDLTLDPIPKLIRKISLPVMIGFFFNTMFNVVDTYFGGKISTDALAALSLSFPVFFLMVVFDSGLSTGATTVIANALGEKQTEKAKKLTAQSISFGLVIALILTVIGPLIAPHLFRLLGATGNYLLLALEYINIIFYGSVFFILISVLNASLQSIGNTKVYRNFLTGGFILNVILDPWFLYGGLGIPAMGFKGVAIATVFIQLLGVIYLLRYCLKTGLVSKETLREMRPEFESFKEIAKQAIPASLNLITVGLGLFVITYFMNHFGKDAVAAYGIATRVEQIALLPTIGLTVACLSIIGQNNGARQFARIKETWQTCLRYGLGIMAFGGVIIFSFSNLIMSFFTDNQNVIDIGGHYLKIATLIFLAYAILFITVSSLQGMKKPAYAVWIGIYRQFLAPGIIFSLLVYYFKVGIDGVWWGIFFVNWSAAIITFLYAKRIFRRFDEIKEG